MDRLARAERIGRARVRLYRVINQRRVQQRTVVDRVGKESGERKVAAYPEPMVPSDLKVNIRYAAWMSIWTGERTLSGATSRVHSQTVAALRRGSMLDVVCAGATPARINASSPATVDCSAFMIVSLCHAAWTIRCRATVSRRHYSLHCLHHCRVIATRSRYSGVIRWLKLSCRCHVWQYKAPRDNPGAPQMAARLPKRSGTVLAPPSSALAYRAAKVSIAARPTAQRKERPLRSFGESGTSALVGVDSAPLIFVVRPCDRSEPMRARLDVAQLKAHMNPVVVCQLKS